MIDLAPETLDLIKAILKASVPDCNVHAFGSRINGTAKQYSDLDLVLIGKKPLDWHRLEKLKDAFSNSNLPIIIDVMDWHQLTPEFQSLINQHYEVIQTA